MKNTKLLLVLSFLVALSISLVACGSSSEDVSSPDSISEPDIDDVQITLPDSVFTVDDVAAVGWKKSKEFSVDTLPGATSVWYGFYQQRDVEVRVYESQSDAISLGQDLADKATGRRKPSSMIDSGAITNAQTNTRTSYLTYAIVGNLIMLCEIKIEDCQGLIDAISQ
ncbi:DUF6810 family protein [Candidatus Lucifugimonas marina]|jgi:hypothetical protein|uniref:DUF6810 domain-containing protein n=1 Tax=Candidatus Lucifugimonas marina TaxID=3038979 RepID=A0AAJ5ZCA8_9CHLR|nr:hypothetical protein [SAR202 cluster bacterium JH702]MDG0870969.1 hypothetical protein [SAR202 cluster bacterium JH639]WFG34726.1 hypothetical protein GKN94_03195 [SAR202 cluster bacterium JH545]WFG38653.1 hypothetical protein GKO48_03200 [SAR202 cluster bacterium JH1073]